MENQNQMPSPVNTPSGSKVIPIILVSVVVALIAIGLYLLATKQNQTAVQNQQGSVVPTAIPTPTPDETVDWQTYKNSKYGYLVKYPNDWSVNNKEVSSDKDLKLQSAPIIKISFPLDRYFIEVSVTIIEEQTTEEYLRNLNKLKGGNLSVNTTINGVSASETTSGDPKSNIIDTILIAKKGFLYTFTVVRSSEDIRPNSTFDQILATFQFSD